MVKVECPSCSAPYDLDEQRLPASGLRMRCPKCGASFHVNRDGSVSEAKASVHPPKAPKAGGGDPPSVSTPARPSRPRPHKPTMVGLGDTPSRKPGALGSATAAILAEIEAQEAQSDLPAVPPPSVDLPAPKVSSAPAVAKPAGRAEGRPASPKKPVAPPFVPPPPPPPPALAATRKKPIAPAFDELDLPAPKSAPASGAGSALDELDLPAPKSAADGDLDLPTPMDSGTAPKAAELDDLLPAPRRGSTPFDDLMSDLPAPLDSGTGVDLPAPAGSADLPAPKSGGVFDELDLPMPKAGDDLSLDLPAPRGAVDLPAPSGGVDLPAPSGGVDLPTLSDGLDVPSPRDQGGLIDELNDLSLPKPRQRAFTPVPGETPDGRSGAGGASFGELDLGDDGDGLEFDDIPEEADADLDAVGGLDLPVDGPVASKAGKTRKGGQKPARDGADKKPRRTGLWVTIGLLLAAAAGGVALKWTPYGIFGMYYLERFRAESGDPATIGTILEEADTLAADDTYEGIRAALRKLADARRQYYLSRSLLARSAMHEALFQVRFGENPRSQNRERTILERLAVRGNDAPGIELALAASRLRSGDPGVDEALAKARAANPDDPYVSLIAGELALQREDFDTALAAFQVGTSAGARWLWGIARTHRAAGHRDEFADAVAATLEASPAHAAALVAQGGLALALGDVDRAEEAALLAVGERPLPDGRVIRASALERAEAYGLLGRVYEHRGLRGRARQAYEAAVAASPFDIESLLGLGRVLLQERRYRDALSRFDAAEQAIDNEVAPEGELPYDVQIGIGKVQAQIPLEQIQEAHATMTALAQSHPELPTVVLWLGKVLEAMERPREALVQYERAIALAPDRFDGYLAAVQLHFAEDRPVEAGEVLERARSAVEPTSEVRQLLGQSELRRNRLERAIAEFRAALELDERNADAMYGLAVAYRRAGRLEQAVQALEQLAALDSAYPGLALERGRVFEAQGHPERAVRMYERALEATPDDLSLLLRLGTAQVAALQLDDAEQTLQRVLAAEQSNPEAEHFMGRVAFHRGQYETALVHLNRAVALNPAVGDYHLWLGWTYLRQNNLARAMESVQRAIDIDENLGAAYYVRGQVELRGGAVRDAAADFERALQLQPSLTIAYAGLAEAYDQLGERNDAIAAYTRAVQREPSRGEWYYRLGKLQMEGGRRGEALVSLTRATTLGDAMEEPPNWLADAHRVRGDAHRAAGEREAARTHYRRYLELAPQGAIDREEVERILERMR